MAIGARTPTIRVVSALRSRSSSALTLLIALVAVVAFGGIPAPAVAAAKPKVRCKAGLIPKVTGSGTTARLVTRRGKAVCVAPPAARPGQIEAPATTQQGTIASTTDQLSQALLVNPQALARAERKLGKPATRALVDRAMNGWRAAARAQARRLADDGYHFQGNFGDPAKGTSGSARLDAGPAGEGGAGIKATASIEFTADGKGLKDLGADKVTSAKSAKVKLEVAFEDAPTQCPTAAGKVKGAIKASATLSLTTDGTTVTMSAALEATYELTVGGDARWKTIDAVDVQTTFTFGGTGKGTETWRGRRGGSGFGQRGVFGEGSGDFTDAIKEQQSHIDQNQGGVWGPRGRVLFSDPSTDNAFNYGGSFAHLKGMILTDVATTYLTYAAVEYIRQVVAPRGQKHWYDDEACLRLQASPDKPRLGAGEQATVTASDAKAADGTPVAVTTTQSGVATFEPGTAAIPATGTKAFTLTAPNQTPTRSTWQIVALSPAGKKTVTGSLASDPKWQVTLNTAQTFITAGYQVHASLAASIVVEPMANSTPPKWNGAGPLQWSNLTWQANDGCQLSNPITGGTFVGEVTQSGDQISLALGVGLGSDVSWTLTCPDSEGSGIVYGPTPVILNTVAPLTFPATGGTQPLRVEVTDGPDGVARTEGTVTVTPVG